MQQIFKSSQGLTCRRAAAGAGDIFAELNAMGTCAVLLLPGAKLPTATTWLLGAKPKALLFTYDEVKHEGNTDSSNQLFRDWTGLTQLPCETGDIAYPKSTSHLHAIDNMLR
jgi:hypothetical protein